MSHAIAAPAAGVVLAVPCYVAAMLSNNPYVSIAILVVPSLLNSLWLGPAFGTVQNLAPMRMRALASAINSSELAPIDGISLVWETSLDS